MKIATLYIEAKIIYTKEEMCMCKLKRLVAIISVGVLSLTSVQQVGAEEVESGIGFDMDFEEEEYSMAEVGGNASGTDDTRSAIVNLAYSRLNKGDWKTYVGKSSYEPWCVYFANWCVHNVVSDRAKWPDTGSTNALVKWFQNNNRWHNRTSRTWSYSTAYGYSTSDGSDDGYIPQPADFAAIENDIYSSEPDHTGLVYGVDDNYIYTVEGNISGIVVFRKYGRNNLHLNGDANSSSYIVGFGEPDFVGGGVTPSQPAKNRKPQGCVDRCIGDHAIVLIDGWAFDIDTTSESIEIHVYIGGLAEDPSSEPHNMGKAANYRDDVNKAYNIDGNHGFSFQVPTNKRGQQVVSIYAIDTAGGENTLIARQTVNISDPAKESKMSFDKDTVNLMSGEEEMINCYFEGDNLHQVFLGNENDNVALAEFVNFDWVNTVASIRVRGKEAGSTNVFLQFVDEQGNEVMKKSVCVNVEEEEVEETEAASITLDANQLNFSEGESGRLRIDWTGEGVALLDAYPQDDSLVDVKWGDFDPYERYAYVELEGKKAGRTTIITKLLDSNGNEICQKCIDLVINPSEQDVRKTYSITYLLGGNDVNNSGNITEYTPANIQRAIRLLTPVRNGYEFAGWYNVDTGEQVYMITNETKGDLVLQAKWKEKKKDNKKNSKKNNWYWLRWFKW